MGKLTELKLRRFILMRKINSYDELNSLIMKHLKKGVYTNCFISKDEFEDEIKNGNLFYHSYHQQSFYG